MSPRSIHVVPRFGPQVTAREILRVRTVQSQSLVLPGEAGETLLEGHRLFALASASAALVLLLRAMELPPGAGVGLPVYTCGTVFESIQAAGLKCVFLDIRPDTFEIDLDSLHKCRDQLAVIIAIHMFGYPNNVAALRQATGSLPVIEDCAHAFGSLASDGRSVGWSGVGAVFSFNLHKPVSVGGGGMLVVNDLELIPAVREQLAALPPPRSPNVKTVLCRMAKAISYRPPFYGLVADVERMKPTAAEVAAIELAPMNPLDRALVARGIARNPQRQSVRRQWAQRLSELTAPLAPANRLAEAGQRWNGYMLPVLVKSARRRDEALAFFHRQNIEAFVLYRDCLRIAAGYGYQTGQCPHLEEALSRLLLLPCYAELSLSQRRRIERAVVQWVSVGVAT